MSKVNANNYIRLNYVKIRKIFFVALTQRIIFSGRAYATMGLLVVLAQQIIFSGRAYATTGLLDELKRPRGASTGLLVVPRQRRDFLVVLA